MTAKLHVPSDEPSLAAAGADIVCDIVRAVPSAVVTFATGESAKPIYRALTERVDRREIDFSHVRVFELDGYVGIPLDDRRSLYAWLMRDVIVPLRIPERAITRLRGEASDPVSACRGYDRALDPPAATTSPFLDSARMDTLPSTSLRPTPSRTLMCSK